MTMDRSNLEGGSISAPPRYSIVVPCTRPYLVERALASALAQDFDDFEIVLSDNSPDGCDDILNRLTDSRLRVVRPEGYMTAVRHWDFAFSQTRGDWVLLLCDDDALTPDCLSSIETAVHRHSVEVVAWTRATYYDAQFWEEERRNKLLLPAFSDTVTVHDSEPVLAEMFANGCGLRPPVKEIAPHPPRAAWSRRLMEDVRNRLDGDLFVWPCPMTSAATAFLALTQHFARIDRPLTVLGHCINSAAAHHLKPDTYIRQNMGENLTLSPVKSMSVFPATTTESLLRTQARMPDLLGHYTLNRAAHYVACEIAVRELETKSGDAASAARQALSSALAGEPGTVRAEFEAQLAAGKAGRPGDPRNLWQRLLRRFGLAPHSVSITLDTTALGLSDITECAAYIARLKA